MEIDRIIITINGIDYQSFENQSPNWARCELCDFYCGKCCANEDVRKICDVFKKLYWQDVLITIKNKFNNERDYLATDMINNLKREGIYRNESI